VCARESETIIKTDCEINGLKLHSLEPENPVRSRPVLFIHGMWSGAWFWQDYLKLFAAHGYSSHALDLRGRNGSRPVPDIGKVSLKDYISDVREVAEALDNPVLIGHSVGGLLALKLAELLNPPAVVAMSPAPPRGVSPDLSWNLFRAALVHLPRVLLRRPLNPVKDWGIRHELDRLTSEERVRLNDRLVPDSGRVAWDIAGVGVPVVADNVDCPLLVVGATEDQVTRAKMVRKIAAKFKSDYREYPGFGHNIVLERGWERVATDIVEWLEKGGQGGNLAMG
jgi:pimeloyl-ACP methyl ester carboxylesterase